MVSLAQIQTNFATNPAVEYHCLGNLNLYDAPTLSRLATQAVSGRQLRITALPGGGPVLQVQLCEDDYPGWLAVEDLDLLEPAEAKYQAVACSASEIRERLPQVITYLHQAMQQPNRYLWGGTVGPNYDCSGLMQTSFAVAGIWLPRDAYQQEAFVEPVEMAQLQTGALVFFGPPERATHVGFYLGEGQYIHSSGKEQGRNGIGIDLLSEQGDQVSQTYYRQLRGAGRIVASYIPSESL
ncbi:MAG: C40 family peptidase [Elainella sp.]